MGDQKALAIERILFKVDDLNSIDNLYEYEGRPVRIDNEIVILLSRIIGKDYVSFRKAILNLIGLKKYITNIV